MPDARIVTIRIAVEVGTTHFQIRFSADAGVTWVGFDPAVLAPTAPADIAIAALDANSDYLLDGINTPLGNQAAASAEANYYEIRLKNAGGYGTWSDPFQIVAEPLPLSVGPLADAYDVIDELALHVVAFKKLGKEDELERLVGRVLVDVMDEIRIDDRVDLLYTDTLTTAAKKRVLARVEKLLAAAMLLFRPAILKALGVYEPLDQESSDEMLDIAAQLRELAEALLAKLVSVTGTDARPFAMPAVRCSTFVTGDTDRTPSERNLLVDERDDVSRWDTENG